MRLAPPRRPLRQERESARDEHERERPPHQLPGSVDQASVQRHEVNAAVGNARERGDEAGADGESEEECEPVLLRGRSIGLDAVDAVQGSLELPQRRGCGEEAAGKAEHDGDPLVTIADRLRLGGRGSQQLTRRTGSRALDRCDDGFAERVVAEDTGETDERDGALDDDEHAEEGEASSVAEAVRDSKALERVDEEVPASVQTQRLERVVSGEIPGLGDEVRGAHRSPSGTMTLIASGSIEKCSSFVAGRAPPSSS